MRKVGKVALGLLLVAQTPVFAGGVTPHLPLNLLVAAGGVGYEGRTGATLGFNQQFGNQQAAWTSSSTPTG